jgi:hypothetical protein
VQQAKTAGEGVVIGTLTPERFSSEVFYPAIVAFNTWLTVLLYLKNSDMFDAVLALPG